MSNTLCEGCCRHSFLIPLHGGKGGPLHPGNAQVRAAPRRHHGAAARAEAIIERGKGSAA